MHFNGWHGVRNQLCSRLCKYRNRFPARIVIAVRCPPFVIFVGIINFAIVNAIVGDWTRGPTPAFIGSYPTGTAVVIRNKNLRNRFLAAKPLHPVSVPPLFIWIVPPVSEVNSERIVSLFQ